MKRPEARVMAAGWLSSNLGAAPNLLPCNTAAAAAVVKLP